MASDFDPGQTSSLPSASLELRADRFMAEIGRFESPEAMLDALRELVHGDASAASALHRAALEMLFTTDDLDPELTDPKNARQPGTECLMWIARNFPDIDDVANAGSEGSWNSRSDDNRTRYAGHNLLCVAVEHLRVSIDAGKFESIDELIRAIESILAYIDESDFPELYASTLSEFGPIAVDVAEAEMRSVSDDLIEQHSYRFDLDTVLGRVADPFLDIPIELQSAARKNISTGSISERVADDKDYDFALVRSIKSNDARMLALLVRAGEADTKTIGHNVWDTLQQLLTDGDEQGMLAFNVIYDSRPGYFSKFSNLDDDSGDIFYGRKVGEAVGMAGHADAIRDLVNPESKQDNMISTVAGIVTGLGMTSNYDGLALLESRLTHWSTELRDQVKQCFEDGQKKAGRPISVSDLEDKTV